jgi:hypothetical protein
MGKIEANAVEEEETNAMMVFCEDECSRYHVKWG